MTPVAWAPCPHGQPPASCNACLLATVRLERDALARHHVEAERAYVEQEAELRRELATAQRNLAELERQAARLWERAERAEAALAAAKSEVERLATEHDAVHVLDKALREERAALARAREVLRTVEWEGHHMGRACCPMCGGLVVYTEPFKHEFTLKDDHPGHRADCALKAALSAAAFARAEPRPTLADRMKSPTLRAEVARARAELDAHDELPGTRLCPVCQQPESHHATVWAMGNPARECPVDPTKPPAT